MGQKIKPEFMLKTFKPEKERERSRVLYKPKVVAGSDSVGGRNSSLKSIFAQEMYVCFYSINLNYQFTCSNVVMSEINRLLNLNKREELIITLTYHN